MKKKPLTLKLMAVFFLCIALCLPLQIMFMFENLPWEVLSIAVKLTPLNWTIFFCAPVCAALIYQVSFFSLPAVLIFSVIVVLNNWFVAELSTHFSALFVGASTWIYLLIAYQLFTQKMRKLFLNPEQCWWKTPLRKKIKLDIACHHKTNGFFYFNSFDLSENGAFLECDVNDRLKIGDEIQLEFLTKNKKSIQLSATIVRKTNEEKGGYPAGFGVQFKALRSNQRRALNQYVYF